MSLVILVCFVFFNDTATTEIYTYCHTLSLHDALPIYRDHQGIIDERDIDVAARSGAGMLGRKPRHQAKLDRLVRDRECARNRSEEHTPELQSLRRNSYADCCLKKKRTQ